MSSLHNLKPFHGSKKTRKTVGRGNGSGHGTYSTRGGKGQTARSGGKLRAQFEGGQTPLVKRIPKLKGFRNPNQKKYQIVNVGSLEIFNDNDTVDIVTLFESRLIANKSLPVKLLGDGELTKKLSVKLDRVVTSARTKIEAAKGEVVELIKKTKSEPEAK